MPSGFKLVAAIEYCIAIAARQAQRDYEARLDATLEEVAQLESLQSSKALKLTLHQIRTLRHGDRDERALEIFRTNFPELSQKSAEEVLHLIGSLNEVERKAGRSEVMKLKIAKSNIHTVLKPLDKEWNTRFGLGLIQTSPNQIQARAHDLLETLVDDSRQFEVWQGNVFQLFVDALVFQGKDEGQKKPIGTIDPRQLRLYRRNWYEWCKENEPLVIEEAKTKSLEELTKNRTRGYYLSDSVRRLSFSQKAAAPRLNPQKLTPRNSSSLQGDNPEKSSEEWFIDPLIKQMLGSDAEPHQTLQEPLDNLYKVTLTNEVDKGLVAERTWKNAELLDRQVVVWIDLVMRTWVIDLSRISIGFEGTNETGSFNIEFRAKSSADISDTTKSIDQHFRDFKKVWAEIYQEMHFPVKKRQPSAREA